MTYETKSSDIFNKLSDSGKQKVFDFMQQLMTCSGEDARELLENAKKQAALDKSKNGSM